MAARRRSRSLKSALMFRIVLVALLCFAAVVATALVKTRLDLRRMDARTATLVAGYLEFQLLRVASGLERADRFPDWELPVANAAGSGQCVRFEGFADRVVRRLCVGVETAHTPAPDWFAGLYRLIFPAPAPSENSVRHAGRTHGVVWVFTDPRAELAGAWAMMQPLMALTGGIALSLCALSYVVVGRALAPAGRIVAGLDRIAAGDFGVRLPSFAQAEFRRMGEVVNQMATKIQATLAERAELSRKLMNAQEQERVRLAREMHDEFAQNLTAVSALAAALRQSGGAAPEIRALTEITAGMMTSLRRTLTHLRPAELDRVGLGESLKHLVAVWNVSAASAFEARIEEPIDPLPEETAIHVYRIAQEALTNAARHAGARRVLLRLARTDGGGALSLTVEDDGAGWRERDAEAPEGGMGLLNMRDRAAALGGCVTFETLRNGGLRVRAVIPVDGEGA